jgi:hypothetical protein
LPFFAKSTFRQALSSACAAHAALGPASLVLYDVTTLYFETDTADGFREPGFSKERRLEPQITVGLLTDAAGFPLAVKVFEGNKAETATMLPVINAFKAAYQLQNETVVADAAMVSQANQTAIEAAGLKFILGTRLTHVLDVIRHPRRPAPGAPRGGGTLPRRPRPTPPLPGPRRSATGSTHGSGPTYAEPKLAYSPAAQAIPGTLMRMRPTARNRSPTHVDSSRPPSNEESVRRKPQPN